jgi:hypothetical protein
MVHRWSTAIFPVHDAVRQRKHAPIDSSNAVTLEAVLSLSSVVPGQKFENICEIHHILIKGQRMQSNILLDSKD